MNHPPLLSPDRVLMFLTLVPYLREHGPTPLEKLAEHFGVPEAELRRMMHFLGTAGIPGETLAYLHDDLFDIDWDALDSGIASVTHTVAIDETPRFTGVELSALVAGLELLAPTLTSEDRDLSAAIISRITADSNDSAPWASVSATESTGSALLPLVHRAIAERRFFQCEYQTLDGNRALRILEPWYLEQLGQGWYVIGWSRERQAERTFRLEHMSAVHLGDRAVQPRPMLPRDSAERSRPTQHSLTALVAPHVLPRLRAFAPERLDEAPTSDGRVTIRVSAWTEAAAIRLVQQAPTAITILAPAAAREAVIRWARVALGAIPE